MFRIYRPTTVGPIGNSSSSGSSSRRLLYISILVIYGWAVAIGMIEFTKLTTIESYIALNRAHADDEWGLDALEEEARGEG
jgi:hypothetical protein